MDDLPPADAPIKVYENTYLMKPSEQQRLAYEPQSCWQNAQTTSAGRAVSALLTFVCCNREHANHYVTDPATR